jgi:hypothetical protein
VKITRHKPHEDPHAATTTMQLIGKLPPEKGPRKPLRDNPALRDDLRPKPAESRGGELRRALDRGKGEHRQGTVPRFTFRRGPATKGPELLRQPGGFEGLSFARRSWRAPRPLSLPARLAWSSPALDEGDTQPLIGKAQLLPAAVLTLARRRRRGLRIGDLDVTLEKRSK